MRFHMTAAAVARDRKLGRQSLEMTELNRKKVTRYRTNGEEAFEDMVGKLGDLDLDVVPENKLGMRRRWVDRKNNGETPAASEDRSGKSDPAL
jgi:large subunit ribosomal protein L17